MTENKTITVDHLIGDVIRDYPQTLPVFKRHFGEGCFTCPGARLETIAFGALMHGLDANAIVNEMNECLTKVGTA
jgi:hybrid cluster-associated redox disulfide protein